MYWSRSRLRDGGEHDWGEGFGGAMSLIRQIWLRAEADSQISDLQSELADAEAQIEQLEAEAV